MCDANLHHLYHWQQALQWMRHLFTFISYYDCSSGIMWPFEAESREELGPQPASATSQTQAHGVPLGAWLKNKPRLRDLHSGVTAGGEGSNHKGEPIRIVCMHVCTYIIHVHKGIGQKKKEHNTYIRKGKRASGDWGGPAYPLGCRCCQQRPSSRQLGWVGGWHTKKKKAFHWNTAANRKRKERQTERHYLCLVASFTSAGANKNRDKWQR